MAAEIKTTTSRNDDVRFFTMDSLFVYRAHCRASVGVMAGALQGLPPQAASCVRWARCRGSSGMSAPKYGHEAGDPSPAA